MKRSARSCLAGLVGAASLFACQAASAETFTVAVLPDTQNFSEQNPQIYDAMTQWIADNRVLRNIVFVSHVGDIVQHGPDLDEWANARASMDILAGVDMPFGTAMGNHDNQYSSANFQYPPSFNEIDLVGAEFRTFFGPNALYDFNNASKGAFFQQTWYGGAAASELSSYQTIEACGLKLLFLNLEVDVRDPDLAWAKTVIENNPDHIVIITTHRYLYDFRAIRGAFNDFIYQFDQGGLYYADGNGAPTMRDELVTAYPNVLFLWAGHVDGEVRFQQTNSAGLPAWEILQDYQTLHPLGGDGWLRLYEFDCDNDTVTASTFSPTTVPGGKFRTVQDQVDSLLFIFDDLRPTIEPLVPDLFPLLETELVEGTGLTPASVLQLLLGSPDFIRNAYDELSTGMLPQELADLLVLLPPDLGITVEDIEALLADFPFEDVHEPFIDVINDIALDLLNIVLTEYSTDPAVRATMMLDALRAYLAANNGQLLRDAFFTNANNEPSFVLNVDFDQYFTPTVVPCVPDLDPPGGDGALGFFDLVSYLTLFAAMDPIADLDPPGGDGSFGFFDLVVYLTLFAAGCP